MAVHHSGRLAYMRLKHVGSGCKSFMRSASAGKVGYDPQLHSIFGEAVAFVGYGGKGSNMTVERSSQRAVHGLRSESPFAVSASRPAACVTFRT